MHIISDASLKRPDYTYYANPTGGWYGYPTEACEPHINWKHIDGPLLICSNGKLHWLTIWERLRFLFGFETIYTIDYKRR